MKCICYFPSTFIVGTWSFICRCSHCST